jgi:CheY-like chemotaxis protein
VLIVDDDVPQRVRAHQRARGARHEVRSPRTGARARHARADADVDLVLMDVMMPEMDGYETMRAIREPPKLDAPAGDRAHGQGDEGRPRASIAAGASDYITKPVDVDQLVSLMRVWLYRRPA